MSEFGELTRDWEDLKSGGGVCWLLTPRNAKDKGVRRLLARGRRSEVNKAYKCKSRRPWWRVSVKEGPRAFLSYMGVHPRVASNNAGVLVPNSLFELRNLKGVSAADLAVASVTSIFQLSAFLNSRLLGGGLKKLEPSDARRILVPAVHVGRSIRAKIDGLIRKGRLKEARVAADTAILVEALGNVKNRCSTDPARAHGAPERLAR